MEFELKDEHRLIRDTARKIAEAELKPRAAQTDKEGIFPEAQMKVLAENGFLAMIPNHDRQTHSRQRQDLIHFQFSSWNKSR